MAPRFIALQLSHPKGWLGRFVARLMNAHNANMNAFAVRQVDPQPGDRILEIGFGGGVTLRPLIASGAFVAGVDRSHMVVERAKIVYRGAIRAGKADFREGRVEELPFDTASFDKVCTVNTIYFWDTLDAGFREVHRVLRPGGRLVVGFLPKERMDKMRMPVDIFTTRSRSDVMVSLSRVGFRNVRSAQPTPETAWTAVIADKSD